MTRTRSLLLAAPTGRGSPAEEARVAAVLALLRRRSPAPVVLVSSDPGATRTAHPDCDVVAPSELETALRDCEMLCLTGALHDDALVEQAARRAMTAHLLGVPVALVAIEAREPVSPAAHAWLGEILAACESVSAADARTAVLLAVARGRRVEVTAPPVLVIEPAPCSRQGLAVEAAVLAAPGGAALRAAAASAGATALQVVPETDWRVWWRMLSSSAVFVTADSGALACALACGAVPVWCGDARDAALLARAGLDDAIVPATAGAGEWQRALASAQSRARDGIVSRVAPLRALGWRALGALADAGRATAWSSERHGAASRTLVAEQCAGLAQALLRGGEGTRAEAVLDAHAAALDTEPAWARARAHVAALLGRDRDAIQILERVVHGPRADVETRADLARALVRSGDSRGARTTWTEIARLRPVDPAPWCELGTLALWLGERDEALRCFHEALVRDPEHATTKSAVSAYFATDARAESEFWSTVRSAVRRGAAVAGTEAPAL